jgi:hypothetical protein
LQYVSRSQRCSRNSLWNGIRRRSTYRLIRLRFLKRGLKLQSNNRKRLSQSTPP